MFRFVSDIEETNDNMTLIEWEYEDGGRWRQLVTSEEATRLLDENAKIHAEHEDEINQIRLNDTVRLIELMIEFDDVYSDFDKAQVKWYYENKENLTYESYTNFYKSINNIKN